MPVNTTDIDAIPDYTPAQRLKMYKKAEMDILAAGQSYTVEERQKMSANLAEIRQAIKELEQEVGTASEDSVDAGGLAIIQMGKAQ